MKATDLPPGVGAMKDRHGKIRYRYRKLGYPSMYLRGEPGSEAFTLSYAECLRLPRIEAKPKPTMTRSRRNWISALRGIELVYFIGGRIGPVKIGTTTDLPKRLIKLQTGYPMPLILLACIRAGPEIERKYHAQFSAYRLAGEWFRRSAEITAEIRRLKLEFDQPKNVETRRRCLTL